MTIPRNRVRGNFSRSALLIAVVVLAAACANGHHDEALVRMKAAHALGMIGRAAKEAAPEIVNVLKLEPDHHRRGYVARALGSTADVASLPALEAALEQETDAGAQGEMRGAIARLKVRAAEKP